VKILKFEGHELCKIDDAWVFDLTTFIGYKTVVDNGVVTDYTKAFIVIRNKDTGEYFFDKLINVPVKIQKIAVKIIERYRKEALL
jgi:hypothetical protein